MNVAASVASLRAFPTKSSIEVIARIALAALLGAFAWRWHESMPALLLFPLIIVNDASPAKVFLYALSYYLAVSYEEVGALSEYYGVSSFPAVLVWLAHQSLLSLAWAIAVKVTRGRWFAYAVGAVLVSAPPLGWVSWANPLFVAGFVFPGTGALGILLAIIISTFLAAFSKKRIFSAVTVAVVVVAVEMAAFSPPVPADLWGWAFQTHDGKYQPLDGMDRIRRFKEAGDLIAESKAAVGVLPEGYLGIFRTSIQMAGSTISGKLASSGKTLVAGVLEPDGQGGFYNALYGVGASEGILYRARVPVPLSATGFVSDKVDRMNISVSPVSDLGGRKVLYSLCWENYLLEHIGRALFGNTSAIIAASNLWMIPNEGLGYNVQKKSLESIAKLAGIPVYWSINI